MKYKKFLIPTIIVLVVAICYFFYFSSGYTKQYEIDGYRYTVAFNKQAYKPGDKLVLNVKAVNIGPGREVNGCGEINILIRPSNDLLNIVTNEEYAGNTLGSGGCVDYNSIFALKHGYAREASYSATITLSKSNGDYYFDISMHDGSPKSSIKVPVKIIQ